MKKTKNKHKNVKNMILTDINITSILKEILSAFNNPSSKNINTEQKENCYGKTY